MTVVGFLDIYYCVIIAWTFFYLFASWAALPDLPWDTCGQSKSKQLISCLVCNVVATDGWWNTESCFRPTDNMTANDILLAKYPMHNETQSTGLVKLVRKTTTPVEEFWE